MTTMVFPYGEVDIWPAGAHDGVLQIRCGENKVVLVLHDDLIRQLAAKVDAYLDRRAAERTLAMEVRVKE